MDRSARAPIGRSAAKALVARTNGGCNDIGSWFGHIVSSVRRVRLEEKEQGLTQYEKHHAEEETIDRFPFYKSKVIINELLKFRIFNENQHLNPIAIQEALAQNPNIKPPTAKQIEQLLHYFNEACAEEPEFSRRLELHSRRHKWQW